MIDKDGAHHWPVRVYYEDTDLGGIVYYANYLKFIERGRSEWLRALHVDQAAMAARGEGYFAVRRVEADYRAPARFDDLLDVRTTFDSASGARLVLAQQVLCDGNLLFSALVTLVFISPAARPKPLPPALLDRIGGKWANKPEV
jgi:acyl-CoA thioester hydrolase